VFDSIQFVIYKPNITNYELASEGLTIWTHTTSLTFDLTSDKGKLPRNSKKMTFMGKNGRNLEEIKRGGSLSRMDRSNTCHVTRRNHFRVT